MLNRAEAVVVAVWISLVITLMVLIMVPPVVVPTVGVDSRSLMLIPVENTVTVYE